jgi:uncharacterized protein
MSNIIDRRLNTGQKNLVNRQRFIERSKKQIKDALKERLKERKISDIQSGEKISIPIDGISEPTFGHDWNTGTNRRVLPGNRDFVTNDRIKRPEGGKGKGAGSGSEGSDSDETGQDEFVFQLTKDEFYDLFFDDLELPDLVKKQLKTVTAWETKRAGISNAGNPTNLSVIRTMKQSMGRRLVLRKPHEKEIQELEKQLETLDENSPEYQEILKNIELLNKKVRAVAYVDPIDLRYHVFDKKPVPSTTAVMICIMDVSGSMDEQKKDLAKRFFMLLYMFLQKKYTNLIVEFIRHHTAAERVDEHTFFYDTLSGGTTISSALTLCDEIIEKEYNPTEYNIYVCQASDGDNWSGDNDKCRSILQKSLLDKLQYMAYVEIPNTHVDTEFPYYSSHDSEIWQTYQAISKEDPKLQMTKVVNANDIYSVFRGLFEKK